MKKIFKVINFILDIILLIVILKDGDPAIKIMIFAFLTFKNFYEAHQLRKLKQNENEKENFL